MVDERLAGAVERFAGMAAAADEAGLERAWAWGAYADEGVRFACFRTLEELRELAVRVAAGRAAPSVAQRTVAQYRAAFRDLQAALLGVDDATAATAPAAGEWSAKQALGHIVEADAGFLVVCAYALERRRAGEADPGRPPEAYWTATLGELSAFAAVLDGPLAQLSAYHEALHVRVVATLAGAADDELDLPSRYWEPEPMPLRFRLHRFESHMRQHTVQIDKALAALGRGQGEGRRLARLLYAALAEVEGALIGAPQALEAERAAAAALIAARADEIAAILA